VRPWKAGVGVTPNRTFTEFTSRWPGSVQPARTMPSWSPSRSARCPSPPPHRIRAAVSRRPPTPATRPGASPASECQPEGPPWQVGESPTPPTSRIHPPTFRPLLVIRSGPEHTDLTRCARPDARSISHVDYGGSLGLGRGDGHPPAAGRAPRRAGPGRAAWPGARGPLCPGWPLGSVGTAWCVQLRRCGNGGCRTGGAWLWEIRVVLARILWQRRT